MKKQTLNKIIKTIFTVTMVATFLFVPFPYSFVSASAQLLGAIGYVLISDYIYNKKQKNKISNNTKASYGEYKSDRKEISQKAMEIEETSIKGIIYRKSNEINNKGESYEK